VLPLFDPPLLPLLLPLVDPLPLLALPELLAR
jgi:hypothetical protein